MKFFSAIVAVVAMAASAQAAFSSCGSSSDSLKLASVSYTPNPPKVGQNVCVTIKGTLSKPVTAGSIIKVDATIWGLNVYSNTGDLCNALAGGANPCPIPVTATQVTDCITVPSNVPSGISINLQASATNADKSRIFCISGPLTFSS
ncbi:Phosphatidylglycerol/phosphatidylinositol transfer protein [Gryganskiella cystojenkinii]|nr:Phosphatidylglycerol/phosphatidylinositol transfer protein [Gryganskiella cystojenkinii]